MFSRHVIACYSFHPILRFMRIRFQRHRCIVIGHRRRHCLRRRDGRSPVPPPNQENDRTWRFVNRRPARARERCRSGNRRARHSQRNLKCRATAAYPRDGPVSSYRYIYYNVVSNISSLHLGTLNNWPNLRCRNIFFSLFFPSFSLFS